MLIGPRTTSIRIDSRFCRYHRSAKRLTATAHAHVRAILRQPYAAWVACAAAAQTMTNEAKRIASRSLKNTHGIASFQKRLERQLNL